MSKRTNAELLKILSEERSDYQQEAISAVEEELARRNLSQEQVSVAKQEIEVRKQYDERKANEPLETGFKILTAVFPGLIQIIFFGLLKGDGYDRKARELVRWTIYGIAFYIGLVILIGILENIL